MSPPASSSTLQLNLPPIPNRIIATSPSPSPTPVSPASASASTSASIAKSIFPSKPFKAEHSQDQDHDHLGTLGTLGTLGNTTTPSELDLSKTPPPRSFAPSPPLLSRSTSEVDLESMTMTSNYENGNGNGDGVGTDSMSSSNVIGTSPNGQNHDHDKTTIMKNGNSSNNNGNGVKRSTSSKISRRFRYEDENDLSRLMRTVDFAARKHSCQRRKDVDQTPYINHPIAVSNYLSSTGITDVKVLQAAVLHDTVEDTHTTIEEIAQLFGSDVARIVEECTDDNTLSGQQRKIEQLRSAPHKSKEAKQVKLADKIHNLESIRRCPPVGWGVKRIQAYFIWAKQVTDVCAPAHPPLAEKLQELYETAYTRVDGVYYPCHPGVCGPLTEPEKELIDSRLRALKKGDKVCPAPIFF
ncbi:uncharacterized protein I303_105084 [Kwoniella dejecticola CBS 10117]|uniref:Guanosine-3',5'-bis(diphosphate) 3'-pyrophosphohydrolase MESH1 n=1 Tax=Kwoniella dejecticola CBS 10117 TaxID=1296121 RepID=A0A1A6A3H9_9TREE|nr:uncharacterized protein I303_05470 [Kwoniella dejecticola CBS 10117]OBR84611.1 hypothetical protein I303_05470 [Kwoniella dejecticola CBS 10117]